MVYSSSALAQSMTTLNPAPSPPHVPCVFCCVCSRVCVRGRVLSQILPQYTDLYDSPGRTECVIIRVRKCQECVREGQVCVCLCVCLCVCPNGCA